MTIKIKGIRNTRIFTIALVVLVLAVIATCIWAVASRGNGSLESRIAQKTDAEPWNLALVN